MHEYGSNAGLHLVLRLPDDADDQAIAAACKARGILARPLSRYFIGPKVEQGLLLGYACVPEEQIAPAFAILLECLAAAGAGPRAQSSTVAVNTVPTTTAATVAM